jgi:type IV pilus biogenesis protein PilP
MHRVNRFMFLTQVSKVCVSLCFLFVAATAASATDLEDMASIKLQTKKLEQLRSFEIANQEYLEAKIESLEKELDYYTLKHPEVADFDEPKTLTPSTVSLPVVYEISGFNDNLTAKLAYSSKKYTTAQVGSQLPSGWVVSKITPHGVFVSQNGQEQQLSSVMSLNDADSALSSSTATDTLTSASSFSALEEMMPPSTQLSVPVAPDSVPSAYSEDGSTSYF